MKVEEITAWEAFLGVAKHGNFTRAAKAMNLTNPQLSKRVAKLEDQLGVRLFQRSTRVVSLTDEGKALRPKIESILEDLSGVESFFEGQSEELSGVVKMTSVPFVAHKLLLPVLERFQKKHPKIHIQLELSTRFVNIIEAGFDMAIRIETPKDSELVYRKLVPNDLIFCASPQYLKRNKAPIRAPKDLNKHNLLMLSIHHRCGFRNSKLRLGRFENAKKLTCENGSFLTEMALQGSGILVRSIWDVEEHLKKKKLVQVLENHPLETFGQIYAVIPNKRYLAPRVRALFDFIVEHASGWSTKS